MRRWRQGALASRSDFSQIPAMQAAVRTDFVPVADYLAAEEKSEIRHEYLGGLVYAMAGETRAHNTICLNLATAIRQALQAPCQLYMSGVRVHFELRQDEYYYYPDIVVTCDPRDRDPRVVRYPKLIIEVLSGSTERVDRREKFFAYTTLDSLEEYILVAQGPAEATSFRRATGWRPEKAAGAEARLRLECLQMELALGTVYAGI